SAPGAVLAFGEPGQYTLPRRGPTRRPPASARQYGVRSRSPLLHRGTPGQGADRDRAEPADRPVPGPAARRRARETALRARRPTPRPGCIAGIADPRVTWGRRDLLG